MFESKEESKIESKSENHDYEHKQNQEQEYEFVSNDLFVQEIDDKLLNEEFKLNLEDLSNIVTNKEFQKDLVETSFKIIGVELANAILNPKNNFDLESLGKPICKMALKRVINAYLYTQCRKANSDLLLIPALTNYIMHLINGSNAKEIRNTLIEKATGIKCYFSFYHTGANNQLFGSGVIGYRLDGVSVDYYWKGLTIGIHAGTYQLYIEKGDKTIFEEGRCIGGHVSFLGLVTSSNQWEEGERNTWIKDKIIGDKIYKCHINDKFFGQLTFHFNISGRDFNFHLPAFKETKTTVIIKTNIDPTDPLRKITFDSKLHNSDKIKNELPIQSKENIVMKKILELIPEQTNSNHSDNIYADKDKKIENSTWFGIKKNKNNKQIEVGVETKSNHNVNVSTNNNRLKISVNNKTEVINYEDTLCEKIIKKLLGFKISQKINHFKPGERREITSTINIKYNFELKTTTDGKPMYLKIMHNGKSEIWAEYNCLKNINSDSKECKFYFGCIGTHKEDGQNINVLIITMKM